METWPADSCLSKVDIVKRADRRADPDIFDSFFGFGGFGSPFLADIVNAGWLPTEFFEAVGGTGGGRGAPPGKRGPPHAGGAWGLGAGAGLGAEACRERRRVLGGPSGLRSLLRVAMSLARTGLGWPVAVTSPPRAGAAAGWS